MAMAADAPASGEVTDAVTANAAVPERATSAVTVAVTVPGQPSLEVTDSMTVSGRDRCVSGPLGAHLVIPASDTRHQPVRRRP